MTPDTPPDPTSLTALHNQTTPSNPDLSTTTLAPQTTTIPHYGLNHPKAYLGYTLALAFATTSSSTQDALALTQEHVIGTPAQARLGAINFGLVTPENESPNSDTDHLTPTGEYITAHARRTHDSLTNALEHFDTLRGTSARLTTIDNWGDITPLLAINDPAAAKLITLLQTIHTERQDTTTDAITLPELVHELYYEAPAFTTELFIRDTTSTRQQLVDHGTFNHALLQNAATYRGATVYQFKTILYHLGVLTTRGADTTSLNPPTDNWALEPSWRGTQ